MEVKTGAARFARKANHPMARGRLDPLERRRVGREQAIRCQAQGRNQSVSAHCLVMRQHAIPDGILKYPMRLGSLPPWTPTGESTSFCQPTGSNENMRTTTEAHDANKD